MATRMASLLGRTARAALLAAAAALFAPSPAISLPAATARESLAAAEELRFAEDWYGAIEAYLAAVARNPAYGNVVCRCETVSEAEVVEAIRRGHVTLDGIKFFTRAGMGRCQGAFCSYRILGILMRETGLSFEELTKRGGASRILAGRL